MGEYERRTEMHGVFHNSANGRRSSYMVDRGTRDGRAQMNPHTTMRLLAFSFGSGIFADFAVI
jgi:hypothetical protein